MTPVQVTVEEIYNESEEEYQALLDAVDESLHPRGPDMLYDKFAGFHPTPNSVVLDLGCRDAAHACELSRRFGCRVVGVDLIDANIARAHRRIADGRLEDRVQVIKETSCNSRWPTPCSTSSGVAMCWVTCPIYISRSPPVRAC
ncbi:MAG: class I SAM-dependent methyltransferase [Caldilineaceae bacterium]